jgi:glycerol uptake facilitator-like aquaporin
MKFNLRVRFTAEFLGTAFLVAAVVGSGIMGERLAGGNVAIALLANTVATGAALVSLILTFGSISGAHFNPAVTLADALERGIPWPEVPAYVTAQCAGAILGAVVAHLMFRLPLYSLSSHARAGWSLVFGEFVATFGLLSVIWGCSRLRLTVLPFAVASYITAAYWFTSSTSFANPAVTIARSLSNTFAGIRPADVPWFIAAQFAGAFAATLLFRRLVPTFASSCRRDSRSSSQARPSPVSDSDRSLIAPQPDRGGEECRGDCQADPQPRAAQETTQGDMCHGVGWEHIW